MYKILREVNGSSSDQWSFFMANKEIVVEIFNKIL